MTNAKIIPLEKESLFHTSEMFFSQTDLRGTIQDGNEVFVRVSGYPRERILGKPHNIIRHPDMPKAVFKLFWSTLQAPEPIIAYVKNMSADGSYYWVLAAAFPEAEGYVSIRIKPTSILLDTVKKLYSDVLHYESSHSIEQSLEFMLSRLKELGFDDYRSFAVKAMNIELDQRAQSMKRPAIDSKSMVGLCQSALKSYETIKDKIEGILSLKTVLLEHSAVIVSRYREVKYVALNMITQVDKLGESARTLHVVADTFRNWAEQIYLSVNATSESIKTISLILEQSGFQVGSVRFQLELLGYYSQELKEKNLDSKSLVPFLKLAREAMEGSHQRLDGVLRSVKDVQPIVAELRDALRALYIVRQNGLIEIAQLSDGEDGFRDQISQMGSFITSVGKSAEQLESILKGIETNLGEISSTVSKTQQFLLSID